MRIEMRGIDKSFGSNQVLKQAGFTLESGEVHALMGENGAGKSTMFNAICGDFLTDSGSVVKEKGTTLLSPNCSSILEKSILLLSILAGVPVLKRRIAMPISFRLSVR